MSDPFNAWERDPDAEKVFLDEIIKPLDDQRDRYKRIDRLTVSTISTEDAEAWEKVLQKLN